MNKVTRLHRSSDRLENAHSYIDEKRTEGARCVLVIAISDDDRGIGYDFQQFGRCTTEERLYVGGLLQSVRTARDDRVPEGAVVRGASGALAKLTPRQRAAICWPCDRGQNATHARYHRRNGGWQSILTFDLFAPPAHESDCPKFADKDAETCECDQEPRARAMWHARATTFPHKPLKEWDEVERVSVKRVLKRLLKAVGQGELEIRKGEEEPFPLSIHFYREATIQEIAMCERSRRDN